MLEPTTLVATDAAAASSLLPLAPWLLCLWSTRSAGVPSWLSVLASLLVAGLLRRFYTGAAIAPYHSHRMALARVAGYALSVEVLIRITFGIWHAGLMPGCLLLLAMHHFLDARPWPTAPQWLDGACSLLAIAAVLYQETPSLYDSKAVPLSNSGWDWTLWLLSKCWLMAPRHAQDPHPTVWHLCCALTLALLANGASSAPVTGWYAACVMPALLVALRPPPSTEPLLTAPCSPMHMDLRLYFLAWGTLLGACSHQMMGLRVLLLLVRLLAPLSYQISANNHHTTHTNKPSSVKPSRPVLLSSKPTLPVGHKSPSLFMTPMSD